ncbi:MAG TPA: hypothetical protein VJO13_00890, partial [Ktedonobacterales bacterium]|nr:hypothetical protein [Ktedonobacterales bacterium]
PGQPSELQLWDARSERLLGSATIADGVRKVRITPGAGNVSALACSDLSCSKAQISAWTWTGARLIESNTSAISGRPLDMVYDGRGNLVIATWLPDHDTESFTTNALITLWNAAGEGLHGGGFIAPTSQVESADFSADGSILTVVGCLYTNPCSGTDITWWDASTQRLLGEDQLPSSTLVANSSPSTTDSLSVIALQTDAGNTFLLIWDVAHHLKLTRFGGQVNIRQRPVL